MRYVLTSYVRLLKTTEDDNIQNSNNTRCEFLKNIWTYVRFQPISNYSVALSSLMCKKDITLLLTSCPAAVSNLTIETALLL